MMRMGVISHGRPINSGILDKCVHRDPIAGATALQMSMGIDESSWVVIIAGVLRELGPAHTDLDVLSNFEMQMGIIKSVSGPDRGDLLTAANDLASVHQDLLAMSV